jgi:hypothetical protein
LEKFLPNALNERIFIKYFGDYHPCQKQEQELCSFPNNLTMEKYMDQQGWSELDNVTMIGLGNVNDFSTFKVDGTFEDQAPSPHVQCFLMLHIRMSQELSYLLYEVDVQAIPINRLMEYYGSPEYHVDL